jgi:hypothetical protein
MQVAPTPSTRDRALERLNGLISGLTMAGLAGIVGFGFLAAVTLPGRAQPTAGSPTGTTGSVGRATIAGQPQANGSVGRRHRDDDQSGSTLPPPAQSTPGPLFQAPVQDPFSVGQGQVVTGGS